MAEKCPKDGHTVGWHLFGTNVDYNGRVVTNGDVVGCDFGKEVEEKVNDHRSGALERSS